MSLSVIRPSTADDVPSPQRVHVTVTDPRSAAAARRLVAGLARDAARLVDLDRPDARVHRVLRAGGDPVVVSALLARLVAVSLDAGDRTGGLFDPTVGAAVLRLRGTRHGSGLRGAAGSGALPTCPRVGPAGPRPAPGADAVRVVGRRVSAPAGTVLDLRASTDAVIAEVAAREVADRLRTGVLVDLGGDVAQAGPPPAGGWQVGLPDGVRLALSAGRAVSTVRPGPDHAVVDPRTGAPAPVAWSCVSVVHPRLVTAKALAVAAAVLGPAAVAYLTGCGAGFRLVGVDGVAVTSPGWPHDTRAVPVPRRPLAC